MRTCESGAVQGYGEQARWGRRVVRTADRSVAEADDSVSPEPRPPVPWPSTNGAINGTIITMGNSIEDLLADKYTYRIAWSEEDGEYVGLCAEMPSLSWLDRSRNIALRGCHHRGGGAPRSPESPGTRAPSGDFEAVLRPNRQRMRGTQGQSAQ